MISRIPMMVFQEAVYELLSAKQGAKIYDDVGAANDEKIIFPCVSFGPYKCEPNGGKNIVIFDVTLALEIWSEYEGKKEINEIADDLSAVYTAWHLKLEDKGFCVIDQGIESLEAFPEEEHGYHGTLTIAAKIQQIGGNQR